MEAGLHRPQTRVDVFPNLCSDEHQDGVCVYITACVTAVLLCLWRLSHDSVFFSLSGSRTGSAYHCPVIQYLWKIYVMVTTHTSCSLHLTSIRIFTRSFISNNKSIVTLSTPLNCLQTPVSCVTDVVMQCTSLNIRRLQGFLPLGCCFPMGYSLSLWGT